MDKDRYTADPSEIEEIKRQINQEPAEGEVEAFVGSEDEIRLAKEAKKKEGKVETLGEYIRLNKQTLATAEELEMVLKDRKREDLLEEFSNKPTGAWLYNGADVYFKDKDGNFATFQLAYNDRCKISEFEPIKRNGDGRDVANFVGEKMAATGFEKEGSYLFGAGEIGVKVDIIYHWVAEARRKQALKQGKKEFDF